MTTGLEIVDALLDDIEREANGRPFIGTHVAAAVRASEYRYLWRPLLERYKELTSGSSGAAALPTHVYCDLSCTVITKKVMMVDMDYLYEVEEEKEEEITQLREAHMVMARKYLVKMIKCIYECVHGRPPNDVDIANAVVLLYAELYAEAFDPATVREHYVFALVQNWFSAHVARSVIGDGTYKNVAPGGPFLHCSHAYWLWLHLTAAKVRYSAQDLVTVVYALDTVVYCSSCRTHFLKLKSEYFVSTRDRGVAGCFSRHPNDTLLFHMHNRVNALTGHADMDVAILADYRHFWTSTKE